MAGGHPVRMIQSERRPEISEAARSEGQGGFTLAEALLAITLLTAIFGAAFGMVVSGSHTVEDGILRERLQSRAREVLDRVARDLRPALISPIVDPMVLSYKKLHGSLLDGFETFDFESAEIQWDEIPESRYEWRPTPTETVNGADDDGNGLADEGMLVRIVNGFEVTVARDVPRGGFVFSQVGPKRFGLQLALEALGRGDQLVRAEVATTVYLRN